MTDSLDNMGMMKITDREFARFKSFVYSHFGINLTEDKKTLVVGRMQKYLKSNNFSDFSGYMDWIEKNPTSDAMSELINRISTNHTFFYRESEHFDFMIKKALPDIDRILAAENSNDLRIWCAAAATGEEPYTIMTVLHEYYGDKYSRLNAGLLATDISERALKEAIAGIYSKDKFSHTRPEIIRKYFQRLPDGNYRVNKPLRDEVLFKRLNLMRETFPFKKKFHIIFCRNVMIYFDRQTRNRLVRKMYDCTVKGGYLFIGHSETLGREECPYEYVQPSVYKKI